MSVKVHSANGYFEMDDGCEGCLTCPHVNECRGKYFSKQEELPTEYFDALCWPYPTALHPREEARLKFFKWLHRNEGNLALREVLKLD